MVFAIYYQILLGWKTCKYYYETEETPQPKANPTQEKKGYNWQLGHFFPPQIPGSFFVGWDWFYMRNRLQET